VSDLEATAMKRISGFMRDYLIYSIVNGVSVQKKSASLRGR
jgi:hypothetical protein|tara:strand:+ start:430 stop:552 length:123 start_codon:yes stop_codon:yes gene_type:complete